MRPKIICGCNSAALTTPRGCQFRVSVPCICSFSPSFRWNQKRIFVATFYMCKCTLFCCPFSPYLIYFSSESNHLDCFSISSQISVSVLQNSFVQPANKSMFRTSRLSFPRHYITSTYLNIDCTAYAQVRLSGSAT